MLQNIILLSILIAAVIVLRCIFKKKVQARVIYALWIAVVIKLCVPVPLIPILPQNNIPAETPTPSETVLDDAGKTAQYTSDYTFATESQTAEQTQHYHEIGESDYAPATPATPVTPPPDPDDTDVPITAADSDTEKTPIDITHVLYAAWAVSSAAAALFFAATGCVFSARLHKSRTLIGKEKWVRIYSTDAVTTPCVYGLTPSIYITPEVRENHAYELVLAHEYTHISHGDNLWAIVRILALIAYPWNPLVWAAALLSKRDSEFACDEAVTKKMSREERLGYAQMLVDSVKTVPGGVTGLGSAPLKERINLLTKKRKTSVVALILAVTLTLSAVGCSFFGTKETEKTPDETDVSDGIPEETKTVLLNTVTTKNTPNRSHKYVNEYDEYGRLIKSTAYTDGEEFSVTEYTYDEYGYKNSEKFVTSEMSYIYEWTNNADKNRLKGTEKTEQANGLSSIESEYEYTYDEKGRAVSYDCTTVSQRAMIFGKTTDEQHRTYEYTDEYGSYTMKEWGDNIPETVYQFFFDENGNIDEEIVLTDGSETMRTKFDSHGYSLMLWRKTASGEEVTRYENSYENGLLTKMVEKNEDGKIINTTVITYDGNGNILSSVITGEDGTETSNTVYEYEKFEIKVFKSYNSPVSKAEADALYDAFIKECIAENSKRIITRELRDLDFNGVDEYLVYVTSGYDLMCEIFTIEDVEVKAFTPYTISVKEGKTVPMAKNALEIPLYVRPAEQINTLRSFSVGSDSKTGEKVSVLLSEMMNNTHAYAELLVFCTENGRLKAESEGKYQWSRGIDGTGDVIYYINGKPVAEDSYTEMARSLLRTFCEKYGIDTSSAFAGLHPVERSNLDGFSYNPSKRTVRFGDSEPVTLGEDDALLILNGSVAPLDAIHTDENGKYHIKVSTMEEYGVMTSLTPDRDGFILWEDYESDENPDHNYPRNGEHSCGLSNGVEDMHSLLYQMKTIRIDDYMYTCGKEEGCAELLRWYLTAEYEKKYGVDYAPLATLPEKSDYQTYERYMITSLVPGRRIGRFVEVIAHEIYYVDLYSHDIFMLHDGAEQTFELVFSTGDENALPAIIDTDGYGNISVKVLSGNTHLFVKSKRYIAAPKNQNAENSDAVQLAAIYDNIAGTYLTEYVFVLGDYGIQGVSTKENGEAEYLYGKQIADNGTEKICIYKTDPFEIIYDGDGMEWPTFVYDGKRIIFYDSFGRRAHDVVSSDGKQLHTDDVYNSLDLLPDGNLILCGENSFTVYDKDFKAVHKSNNYEYVLYDAQANYLYVRADGKMMLTDAYETYLEPYEAEMLQKLTVTNEQHVLDTLYPFLEINQFMDIFVRFFHDEYSKGEELKGNALYAMSLLCFTAANNEHATFSIMDSIDGRYGTISRRDLEYIAKKILGEGVDLTKYHSTFTGTYDGYFPEEDEYHFGYGTDWWHDDPCVIDHDTVVIEDVSAKPTLVYSVRIDIYDEQFSDVVAESKYLTYTFKKVCDNELMYLRLVSIEDTASCEIVSERTPGFTDGMAAVECDVYPFPDDSTKSLGIMWLHKKVLVEKVATVRDNSTGEVSDWYQICNTDKPDITRKVIGWVPVSSIEKYDENASVPDNALYQIKMGAEYTIDGVTKTFDKDSMNVTMVLGRTEENGRMKFTAYGGSTVVVNSKDCVEQHDRFIPPRWANVP